MVIFPDSLFGMPKTIDTLFGRTILPISDSIAPAPVDGDRCP